jgi:NRE family putative nickel resistance protein-like MFS transporter
MMSSVRTETRAAGGYRAVLAIPEFRRLWLAELSARVGEAIAQVALPLLVYRLTESAALMSVIFVIQMMPRAILAPVAGLLADRLDRRRLMIGASLMRAAGVAVLPLSTETWQVAAIAAFVSIGTTIVQPAELAAIPAVVPADRLVPALSLTQVTNGITRIVGPALGAGLIGIAGPKPAFWMQTVCFLIAVAWLWRLALPRAERTSSQADTTRHVLAVALRDIGEGLRVVWRTPIVRGICATEALWSLVNAVFSITAVVYTEQALDLGDRAGLVFGFLGATFSAGAVLGALIASRVEQRIGRPQLLAIGYLGPLMLLPAGMVPPLPLVFACWFGLGFTDAWAVIAFQAYMAESVADEIRGRVYAIWSGVISLAILGAYAVIGWMTDRLGSPATLAVVGGTVGLGGPLLLVATGALAAVRSAPVVRPIPEPAVDRA